jgi:ankyrin repeat protein
MEVWTELFQAADEGDVARVRELEALVNERDAEGRTALHVAAQRGHVEVVTALVQMGADKEAANAVGARPLHWAAMSGQLEVVRLLLQLGADWDATMHDGTTAHAASLQYVQPQVAALLEAVARSRSTAATAATTQEGACAACGGSCSSSGAACKKCSRCQGVQYCSKLCQLTHWRVHKASCAPVGGAGDPA